MGVLGGGFDGWLHAHEGHLGESLAQVLQGRRGGRVAGHHDQLGILRQQETRDAFRKMLDLFHGTRPVRDVPLVAEIDHVLLGHLRAHRPQHGQSAHARVKDTDGMIL